jgi:choline dehydrogenase
VAADSLRITRKISQGALHHPAGGESAGVQFQTDEDWRLAGDIATTIFSPGRDKKWARRRPDGGGRSAPPRRGVRGLRVVAGDAITSGNTNSPTLMIAEKAAQWIQAGI